MMPFLRAAVRAIVETFDLPSPILAIGASYHGGAAQSDNLRQLFGGKEYLSVDVSPRAGVDLVANVEALPYADAWAGTVVALDVFAHARHFWRGFDEIRRVLRPDGALLVSCPFQRDIEAMTADYWRFTPEAFQMLLADYPSRLIGWHGPDERPENVWAAAFREQRPAITRRQLERYRALVEEYARQAVPTRPRLRLQFLAWLNGHRVPTSIAEAQSWETICVGLAQAQPAQAA